MKLLSHRGYWKQSKEKNTAVSFERSFSMGLGTETDIRDYNGEVVISHDIPTGGELKFIDMLKIYNKYDSNLPLALNIKSDGLQGKIKAQLQEQNIKNYFLFDMSMTDHIVSLKQGLKCYTRHSEYDNCPLYEKSAGIWIDCFDSDWINENVINKHLQNNKTVCIVSPELHGREYISAWEKYKNIKNDDVMLCTDLPEKAMEFFNG
ncbi:MAG: hypothetical protein ACJ0GZ_01215 [Alphaproteobacteria bacterium]